MNGNVFECCDRRQYTKTLQASESHAKKTLKCVEDLAPLFATESRLPVLAVPATPAKTADGKEPSKGEIEL
jgi:hypothetical protein